MKAIIIPTYNESNNIGLLIDEIFTSVPKARVVVIDDNSPDGTAQVVRKKQKRFKRLDLLIRTENKGRGASVLAGFRYALKKYPTVSYFIEMDSDFSHAPSDILKLLAVAQKKTVVIGSRYVPGSTIIDWPQGRIILSKYANWYIRLILGIPIQDYTMGFRCYSREALAILQKTKIRHKGFITLSEIAYRLYQANFTFIEVPITLRDRTQGRSNATLTEVVKSFIAILQIRFW